MADCRAVERKVQDEPRGSYVRKCSKNDEDMTKGKRSQLEVHWPREGFEHQN